MRESQVIFIHFTSTSFLLLPIVISCNSPSYPKCSPIIFEMTRITIQVNINPACCLCPCYLNSKNTEKQEDMAHPQELKSLTKAFSGSHFNLSSFLVFLAYCFSLFVKKYPYQLFDHKCLFLAKSRIDQSCFLLRILSCFLMNCSTQSLER